MVSLDKLIQDLEEMTANPNENDYENQGYWMAIESIYYLKQYREEREELKEKIAVLWQSLESVKYSSPIPWEFLILKIGKPVWIKFRGAYESLSRWAIITRIKKDIVCFTASDGVQGYNGFAYKKDKGIDWEIYDREQK